MQNLVTIYEQNAQILERFILSSLKQINLNDGQAFNKLFTSFPSLELIYECDTSLVQTSPNIHIKTLDNSQIGIDRGYLVSQKDSAYEFHSPYLSSATGQLCMTLMYKTPQGYLFLDFSLRRLLERFDLIEDKKGFNRFNTYAYGFIASGLIFLGLFSAGYGVFNFINFLFSAHDVSLEIVFKPVIALTLGLAVYDLGKTILEQDVLPHTKHRSDDEKAKNLVNFLVSIIIALFIEALLIVFKISIQNYHDLPYGALFIVSLAALLWVFSYFNKNSLHKGE